VRLNESRKINLKIPHWQNFLRQINKALHCTTKHSPRRKA